MKKIKLLVIGVLPYCLWCWCWTAQAQSLPNLPELLPPRSPTPIPPQIPSSPPSLEIPPLPPTLPSLPNRTLRVREFRVTGNTVFRNTLLQNLLSPYLERELTSEALGQALQIITNHYRAKGWILATTRIPIQSNQNINPQAAILTLEIIEGKILAITFNQASGPIRNQGYVRRRLTTATQGPFNLKKLETELRFLSQDPRVQRIATSLLPAELPGEAHLEVALVGNRALQLFAGTDNLRSPAVGSWQRRIDLNQLNLAGIGDTLQFSYRNTNGSNAMQLAYRVPLHPRGLDFAIRSTIAASEIIESPFEPLDIQSSFRSLEFDLSQVVFRRAQPNSTQLLRLGATIRGQNIDTRVLGEPFPISEGADDQGRTRLRSLNFYQEWEHLGAQQTLLGRSEFSFGLAGFLDGTVNTQRPDSQFISWRGDLVYLRRFGRWLDLLARASAQFADRSLLSPEQFTLGGADSVRGYRTDYLFGNSGISSSLEFRLPLYSGKLGDLRIAPFIDVGNIWNLPTTSGLPSTLLSSGIGLIYNFNNDKLQARLDFGVPLLRPSTDTALWQQDLGLSFSLRTRLY